MTWNDAPPPDPATLGLRDWLRVVRRGGPVVTLVFGGLAILLAVRLLERPLHGQQRPWTPHITQFVCRNALRLMGIRRLQRGTPTEGAAAVVANHASWLDIFALNAAKRVYFVSKSEVASWPGIGWLARATGTVFIRRDRREAREHAQVIEDRLRLGHKLLFFPEGTSTDGLRVLRFKTTLFAAFYTPGVPDDLRVQPVTLAYHAPDGGPATFYGWWGDQSAGEHMLRMLAAPRHGRIDVIYHAPLLVSDYANRKDLALAAEGAVRQGLQGSGVKMVDQA
ncbi:1-acyl-sn-glycerol-3-phosphate acyltransferase [Jannaschia pagri]|uniref:1-acyl-sn-glycerol-3-phosphate acyltransferase n=1 Tax=Jannaschia pagri TaxID=2829797 RepID=A0ABQ4NNR9_9RHOB|nr:MULTISPECIES: lysophospholipid acyltransferase family protein [unclassified Jannaschia]GIT92224.1 1-acyl-sn-glycerol-3-phosphate acyltransferase [Jannaschia sp. AI_61]GIT96058.1 1-acyl-sn-glycerol-3-phosphate acyltransferase [Jannaschia sp. AI_62]